MWQPLGLVCSHLSYQGTCPRTGAASIVQLLSKFNRKTSWGGVGTKAHVVVSKWEMLFFDNLKFCCNFVLYCAVNMARHSYISVPAQIKQCKLRFVEGYFQSKQAFNFCSATPENEHRWLFQSATTDWETQLIRFHALNIRKQPYLADVHPVEDQAANSDRATHVTAAHAGGSKHLVWPSVFILRFVKN